MIQLEHKIVDGAHFFRGIDAAARGVCTASLDYAAALGEVYRQVEILTRQKGPTLHIISSTQGNIE